MSEPEHYELLDFGGGRKLERFGRYTLDRPAPAAEHVAPRNERLWDAIDARYDDDTGEWYCKFGKEGRWPVRCGSARLDLKLTDAGHVGFFPEHAANWDWVDRQIRSASRPLKVLNLFAYTGAGTLVAAAAGAEVVHIDAAANVVAWARRNAASSKLAESPIRWITEDAVKFVRRELKRGNRYDAVMLDPPAYGHGPRGEVWKLDDLAPLFTACLELTANERQFLVLSCHSGNWSQADELLSAVLDMAPELRHTGELTALYLKLDSTSGGQLHCGATVRWTALAKGRS